MGSSTEPSNASDETSDGVSRTFLPVSLNFVCSRYAAAAKLEEKISSGATSCESDSEKKKEENVLRRRKVQFRAIRLENVGKQIVAAVV